MDEIIAEATTKAEKIKSENTTVDLKILGKIDLSKVKLTKKEAIAKDEEIACEAAREAEEAAQEAEEAKERAKKEPALEAIAELERAILAAEKAKIATEKVGEIAKRTPTKVTNNAFKTAKRANKIAEVTVKVIERKVQKKATTMVGWLKQYRIIDSIDPAVLQKLAEVSKSAESNDN